jgi:hypothetical protein
MKQAFPFSGNWLVNYKISEFRYPDVLIDLARLSDYFRQNNINFDKINIFFSKTTNKNRFFRKKNDIFIEANGSEDDLIEITSGSFTPAAFKPLEKPIRTVSLLFPRLESDPRWKSMGLPASHLFLASGLCSAGFLTSPLPLLLPGENMPPGALQGDLAGITLFEDLLPLLRPILADFRPGYPGILAAGGPFPTLAPLAAIFQLPQVNLFVRGEAEMALPRLLPALNRGDEAAFHGLKGIFWQRPGLIAMAGFGDINRPESFDSFAWDLDFLREEDLGQGLEMNFSRGCARGCLFCCRAQGKKLRKLPPGKAEELLNEYGKKAESMNEVSGSPRQEPPPLAKGEKVGIQSRQADEKASPPTPSPKGEGALKKVALSGNLPPSPLGEGGWGMGPETPALMAHFVNINDDDILQDPKYAGEIFDLIKKRGFRIFGIQTSTASLLHGDGTPRMDVLDLVADPGLYADGRPLLWLGTDAFLPARARRLGKRLPAAEKFRRLLGEFEKRHLRHFHYWISSDGDSTWGEFIGELAVIFAWHRDFPNFGLLAHSPFMVPYPAGALYGRLAPGDPRLKLKLALDAPDPRFRYDVADRLETNWTQLNNLLKNEKAGGEKGFFDFLKDKNFAAAAQLAYHFLKQEQLQSPESDPSLIKARKKIEKVIEELL